MKIKILILCLIGSLAVCAQQEPQYTNYMYNMSMVNPGYMINEPGIIQVGSLYRTQWVGIKGAPKTANVFGNVPINNKIELSVNYLNDDIGDNINFNENVFNIDVAYKINLRNDLNVSFGIKMGVDHLSFNALGSNVSTDPLFENESKTLLNIGAGVFLFNTNYYVGLSSPNLIPSDLNINSSSFYQNKSHAFFIAGYVFDLGTDFKLKPSTVVKYVGGAPLSFDVSANVLFKKRIELGASYRYEDAISGLAGFHITSNLMLGYVYDFNISTLKTYNNGSHEFILLYKFDILGLSKTYSSPRFY